MSIANADMIDFIGVDNITNRVVLTISDHLTWEEEEQHLLKIQDKINSYIAFIECGDLEKLYPTAITGNIDISIVHQYPMPESIEVLNFLDAVITILKSIGVGFSSNHLDTPDS
jgi:hypothetical protein